MGNPFVTSAPKPEGYFDVYLEQELRSVYAAMFPAGLFDEDCWFIVTELPLGGDRFLLDGSKALAETTGDPEAVHYCFYSEKGEQRVRAAMEKCINKFRIKASDCKGPMPPKQPIGIGVTRGSTWKPPSA